MRIVKKGNIWVVKKALWEDPRSYVTVGTSAIVSGGWVFGIPSLGIGSWESIVSIALGVGGLYFAVFFKREAKSDRIDNSPRIEKYAELEGDVPDEYLDLLVEEISLYSALDVVSPEVKGYKEAIDRLRFISGRKKAIIEISGTLIMP